MKKYDSMENSKQMEALFKELELPNLRKKGDQGEAKAVVIAMMDTSRSMGRWDKFMARSFFFWMTRFLRSKYELVEIEFITHQTEAKVVSEEDFFSKGESGGTLYSPVYRKALELIERKYDPDRYNIYSIHLSDGRNCDELTPDTARSLTLVDELMEVSNLFGYGELNPYTLHSNLVKSYKRIDNEKFRFYTLKEEADVYYAMKSFFRKETKSKVI